MNKQKLFQKNGRKMVFMDKLSTNRKTQNLQLATQNFFLFGGVHFRKLRQEEITSNLFLKAFSPFQEYNQLFEE